jgi:hypothetical protein
LLAFEANLLVPRRPLKLVSLAGLALCVVGTKGCLLSFDDYPVGSLCDAGATANAASDPVLRGCAGAAATSRQGSDANEDAAGAAGGKGN